jgi:peptidoglycan hydrolase CwlO-like protein
MGKRIRHLEYYGYADQNVYIGLPNADLSDIRETNKEQDKEISELSGATKEKADLELVNELSGKVDTFIDTQARINESLAHAIASNSEKINGLQQRDVEITDKLNELVDDFNPIYEQLGNIENQMNELNSKVDEYADFESEANNKFNEIETELGNKLNKTEAEETYAKKSDVYTKREVDRLLEEGSDNVATKEWVMNRGFITETDADSKYATKARLTALEDRVNDVQTNLYNQYNSLNNDYTAFKNSADARINTLYGRVDTLEAKHDREINGLSGRVEDLQAQINTNKDDIRRIIEVDLPNKVNQADFNDLENDVNQLRNNLNNKVDKADYNIDKNNITNAINNLEDKKADKTALSGVSGAVDSLMSALQDEARQRVTGDETLYNEIQATNERIDGIEEGNVERDHKIAELEGDLEQEIADRIAGDAAIIGEPTDRDVAITIYGTRKYADKVAANAVDEANIYTDNKDSQLRIFIQDEVVDPLEREISGKADKTYVNAVKNDILNEIDGKVDAEKQRAKNEELALASSIANETARAIGQERNLITATTHIGNIVAAMTDWDGDDRIDYTDEGNGIIDVMHREVHDMKKSIANVSEGVETKNDQEAAFGRYNKSNTGFSDAEKTVFSIGIGTSTIDRKNALEIRQNGDIYMWINGQFQCLNTIIGNLIQ